LYSSFQIWMVTLACAKLAKSVHVETLIAELPIKALQVAVLRGLARLDEVERHAVRICPGVQELSSELGAIVDGDLLGHAIPRDELVEDTDHPLPWQ